MQVLISIERLKEIQDLLNASLSAFNEIPNQKTTNSCIGTRNTYELASRISEFLTEE